jgi:hypothetical protein
MGRSLYNVIKSPLGNQKMHIRDRNDGLWAILLIVMKKVLYFKA